MTLTHDWRVVHVRDIAHRLDPGWYVFGGQADDDGRSEYEIHVRSANPQAAAVEIAAVLRGEA